MWSKTCNFGIVRRENFSLPPPPPLLRRQHFREKFFRCPFQYTKVPLEAGAPPNFWCFLHPCSFEQQQLLAYSIQYLFHRFAHHQQFSYYVTGFDHNCDLIPKKAKISWSAVQYFLFQVHVCKLTGYCTLLLFIKWQAEFNEIKIYLRAFKHVTFTVIAIWTWVC